MSSLRVESYSSNWKAERLSPAVFGCNCPRRTFRERLRKLQEIGMPGHGGTLSAALRKARMDENGITFLGFFAQDLDAAFEVGSVFDGDAGADQVS